MNYWVLPFLVILVFCALSILFRKLGMRESRFIVYTGLILGTALGLLSVILWPGDLGVYWNVPGTAFGDWIYRSSIEAFGDPHSDQAHYTVPWIFRIPQVYAIASPVVYAATGLAVQWIYNRIRIRDGMIGVEKK